VSETAGSRHLEISFTILLSTGTVWFNCLRPGKSLAWQARISFRARARVREPSAVTYLSKYDRAAATLKEVWASGACNYFDDVSFGAISLTLSGKGDGDPWQQRGGARQ
jgi:hypothetical protein